MFNQIVQQETTLVDGLADFAIDGLLPDSWNDSEAVKNTNRQVREQHELAQRIKRAMDYVLS